MATLIGRDRNRLHILLHRRSRHHTRRTVMTQMDHLRPRRLQNPPKDVDRSVMTIKQIRRSHKTHSISGSVGRSIESLGERQVVTTIPGLQHGC